MQKRIAKLNVKSVQGDLIQLINVVIQELFDKMIDGIPAFVNGEQTKSRWAVEGYPHYAVIYFDSLVTINNIRINLYKGDQGYTNHIKLYNFSISFGKVI
ncbi:MAG: hypothetical protein H6609_13685 [Ignavibacteriales bacterium]|nr:hypothetical protein [Ignavibacteriales bacterium]